MLHLTNALTAIGLESFALEEIASGYNGWRRSNSLESKLPMYL